ncbi:MAG: hypothetical protein P8K66_00275 [Planctomycetota bacterium]|nr:hypothetical protein [Planctomycetota bacterium]
MKTIHIEDTGAIETIVERVRHEVVLLQLPTVYTLIAAPTREGVEQLNAHKNRLEGKNYGTVLGRADRFLDQARDGEMPKHFNVATRLEDMQGAFIRTVFTDRKFNSSVIREGTHQSLVLDGIHRSLFRHAEESLSDQYDRELWGGCEISNLLCTSANLSGDPLGSITDLSRAEHFSKSRGIGLFVRCQESQHEKGSYPIFEFSGQRVSIRREGPGMEKLIERFPQQLRPVIAA